MSEETTAAESVENADPAETEPTSDGANTEPEPTEAEDAEAEEAAAFDAEKALEKIRKTNAFAKAQRERAKAAEEKVKGLEPAKREAAEQRVARRLGLEDNEDTDYFLSRLQGETVDELAQDAERLLSLMSSKKTTATTTRPKERLRGGGDPEEEPTANAQAIVDSLPRF